MLDFLRNIHPVVQALLATCFTWAMTTLGAAVIIAKPVLPYALGFPAGAMIFVVIEEVIPESQRAGNTDLATMAQI